MNPSPKQRRLTRGRVLTLAAIAAVVGVAGAAAYGFGGRGGPEPVASTSPTTAEVARMTLVDYEESAGVIGFGEVTPLRYTPPPAGGGDDGGDGAGDADQPLGLVTWLPAIASTVERGQPAFRVDNQPVTLLYGALPLYRGLRPGLTGPDVEQFETNLRDLGQTGFTVDQEYTESTATAVKKWQKAIGVAQTGEIAPGQLLFAAGPVRVAEHKKLIGDTATGDILGITGSTRSVSTIVSRARVRSPLEPGTAVTVLLPVGGEVPGTVRRTGPPAEGGDPQSVQVEVDVADQAALDGRQGAATVRFVVAERKDVLAVPVLALVALAEGGYGVQLPDGSYAAVGTGLFARGFVEITSGDLAEGTKVVVPRG